MSVALFIVLVILLFYWLGAISSVVCKENMFVLIKDRRHALTIALLLPLLGLCSSIYMAVGPSDSVFAQIAKVVTRERVLGVKQKRSFIQTNQNLAFVYSAGEEECVRILLEHVADVKEVLATAGVSSKGKGPVVYLYNDYEEFKQVYGEGKAEVVAFYLPEQIHILSDAGRYEWGDAAFLSPGKEEEAKLLESFYHEYVHHCIYQSIKELPDFQREHLPLWFEEGIAAYCASETVGQSTTKIGLSEWIPMQELAEVRSWQQQHSVEAYTQSQRMIQLLSIKYGIKSLGQILDQIGAGEDFAGALYNVTGLSQSEYEQLGQKFLDN